MRNKLAAAIVGAILMSVLMGAPAKANPGSEGVFDPCFADSDSLTGIINRYLNSGTNNYRFDRTEWNHTNVLVRKSGQLFRANSYRGNKSTNVEQIKFQNHSISYDLDNGSKQVASTSGTDRYFSEYAYERLVGWLLDDDQNYVRYTNFTIRSSTSAYDRLDFSNSTTTLSRDCSGRGFGLLTGSTQAQELVISPDTDNTFTVTALSAKGNQAVKIHVPAGAVQQEATLLAWNDPYSTENEFGFSSMGFAVLDKEGKPVPIAKPIRVSFDSATDGVLAYSTDAKDWKWLKSAPSKVGLGSVVKTSSTSFEISAMNGQGWLFVGQKTEQRSKVLYANRFKAEIGSSVMLTTTGGSGKGSVSISTSSSSVCEIKNGKKVIGKATGVCEITAVKAGFDGHVHETSQELKIQIGG